MSRLGPGRPTRKKKDEVGSDDTSSRPIERGPGWTSGHWRHAASVLLALGLLLALPVAGRAQITFDGSLGSAGALTGPNFMIGSDRGRIVGNNLFQSFGQFNVQTGESATFTGPSSIGNIISRVTGGQLSTIDGLIDS